MNIRSTFVIKLLPIGAGTILCLMHSLGLAAAFGSSLTHGLESELAIDVAVLFVISGCQLMIPSIEGRIWPPALIGGGFAGLASISLFYLKTQGIADRIGAFDAVMSMVTWMLIGFAMALVARGVIPFDAQAMEEQ